MDLPAALLRVSDMKDTALDDVAETELNEALLDQLNIVYVGMTRPVERLDVLAETAKLDFDRSEPGTVSQWVLACAEDVSGQSFSATGMALTQGTADRLVSEKTEGAPVDVVTTQLQLGEQAAQQVVMAPAHVSQVHPDDLDDAALGSLVHEMLAEVRHEGDWPEVRSRFEARWTLSPENRATVLSWADGVFRHADSRQFFAPENRVEREPAWMDEAGLIRPDRVVLAKDGWHVVDFKSGEVDLEKHNKQVRRYVEALNALESTTSRGWILYLNPWRLEEVEANSAPRIFDAD